MKPALLVLGHVAAVFLLSEWTGKELFPALKGVMLLAESRAQATLLAIWLGLGHRPLALRLLALPLGLVANALFFQWRFERFFGEPLWDDSASAWEEVLLDCVFQGGAALGCAAALVALRTKFVLTAGVSDKRSEQAWQFSLRQTMGLMFVAAVLLALGRLAHDRQFGGEELLDGRRWKTVGVHAVFQSLIALSAAWAALRPGRAAWRVMLAIIVGVAVGAADGFRNRSHEDWAIGSSALLILESILVTGSLLVIRSAGWRWSRRGTSAGKSGI